MSDEALKYYGESRRHSRFCRITERCPTGCASLADIRIVDLRAVMPRREETQLTHGFADVR